MHELAHQWWGNAVSCRTWNDIWLNEGLATYTEALWSAEKPGGAGQSALRLSMMSKKYFGAGSVYVTNDELTDIYDIFDYQTTYKKAAWVFHMLRHVVGDDTFFEALMTYRSLFEGSAASTTDLQTVFEMVCGDDLDWFFQQWVFGERTPQYEYGYESFEIDGQHYLALYLDQTQAEEYQRFTMPIDIWIDGQVEVIYNDHDPEHFIIPVEAPVGEVYLDPNGWVLYESASAIDYVPGPPTVVSTFPAPGQVVPRIDMLTVTFHTAVNTTAVNYRLDGDVTGTHNVALARKRDANQITLITAGRLEPDSYTLTVRDSILGLVGGLSLDGELADPADPASLPSGDGVAGGAATIRFTVACGAGDADCDGDADLRDIGALQRCFTSYRSIAADDCEWLDLQPDGQIDLADFTEMYAALTGAAIRLSARRAVPLISSDDTAARDSAPSPLPVLQTATTNGTERSRPDRKAGGASARLPA